MAQVCQIKTQHNWSRWWEWTISKKCEKVSRWHLGNHYLKSFWKIFVFGCMFPHVQETKGGIVKAQKLMCRWCQWTLCVFFFFFPVRWRCSGGMTADEAAGREEEGVLQSCRLGCISSRNCSLPCGGHLTVLSPSTEGWVCLKVLGPVPSVRHAWCLIHTRGEYWERLRRNAVDRLQGSFFFFFIIFWPLVQQPGIEELQSVRGQCCEHNCPEFEPEPELHHRFEMYEIEELSTSQQNALVLSEGQIDRLICGRK